MNDEGTMVLRSYRVATMDKTTAMTMVPTTTTMARARMSHLMGARALLLSQAIRQKGKRGGPVVGGRKAIAKSFVERPGETEASPANLTLL